MACLSNSAAGGSDGCKAFQSARCARRDRTGQGQEVVTVMDHVRTALPTEQPGECEEMHRQALCHGLKPTKASGDA